MSRPKYVPPTPETKVVPIPTATPYVPIIRVHPDPQLLALELGLALTEAGTKISDKTAWYYKDGKAVREYELDAAPGKQWFLLLGYGNDDGPMVVMPSWKNLFSLIK